MAVLICRCFPDSSKRGDRSGQHLTKHDKHLVIAILPEKGCGVGVRDANKAADPVCSQGVRLDASLDCPGRNTPEVGKLIDRAKLANDAPPRSGVQHL
jgi:hypothetical protein